MKYVGRTLGLFAMAFGIVVGLSGWVSQSPSETPSTITASDTVEVSVEKGTIDLSSEAASAGSVLFEITNEGSTPHAVALSGPSAKQPDSQVKPGQTKTFTASLQKGTYTVYCPLEDHSKKKTATTLTVEK